MQFEINGDIWTVSYKTKQELIAMYETEYDEKAYYVFGLTQKPNYCIYINQEMIDEQKIKTLKHELVHCYIWEFGLYNAPNYNEEMVCDIVSSSNNMINKIVEQFIKEMLNKEVIN